jgi:H+/Cl- antiporter ClcA
MGKRKRRAGTGGVAHASAGTADGIAVAPGLEPALAALRVPRHHPRVTTRTLWICAAACVVALFAGLLADLLSRLIGLITSISFYGRLEARPVSPADNHLGLWVILVPMVGALIVGVMARYGSAAIRGHGIPEVMERILTGESRIPARVMVLKPISAAIAIGTGGPFGAEGPIIATGGALGSLAGQLLHITADERKTLLAAGAAAGMAATFGTPVAAVLLAVELLLFEYRARSVVPVALAASVGTAVRLAMVGTGPVFAMAVPRQPGAAAMLFYVLLGAVVGALAAGITRLIYAIEDGFEHVPLHWMWWPLLGATVVGVVGWFEPRTLGVGYRNIEDVLSGNLVGWALLVLVVLKFISWSVYLGSGTSGGTMAPLFTVGGGAGALLGGAVAAAAPALGVDPHVAGLVGMAAMFAGASHALLASVVMAFEVTRQPLGLLPLLAGCSAAYLVSLRLSPNSIMTEKLARRGTEAGTEYVSDFLRHVRVADACSRPPVTLPAEWTLERARAWLLREGAESTHQGFPLVSPAGTVVGVLTRRDLLDPRAEPGGALAGLVRRPPVVVFEDNSLREAADHMVAEGVGRLVVVPREGAARPLGILSRSDLLNAHAPRLEAAGKRRVVLRRKRKRPGAAPAVS